MVTGNSRCLLLVAGSLLAVPAWATNGYFSHGYSAAQNALGGAGTALTEDALVTAINPAGIAWTGNRVDVNVSAFSPVRHYQAGPRGDATAVGLFTIDEGRIDSDNELFYVPGLGVSWTINDRSSWGIALYGNGGMNSEYDGGGARFGQNFGVPPLLNLEAHCDGSLGGGAAHGADAVGFCGQSTAGASVNLMQLFVSLSYARKLGERSAVGIAPIFAGQRFRADGLQAFAPFSNQPDKVSDNGYELSYGYGARIGVLTGALPGFGLGASYQTRIRMTELDRYAGLFAEQGGFDIPSTWSIGLSAHVTGRLLLAFDYQRINFSEVASVGNPLDPNRFVNDCALPRLFHRITAGLAGSDAASSACLGADQGSGFGWKDVDVYKLGVQYRFAALKLRAGYSRNSGAIDPDEVLFNILAPAVVEQHYTLGVSYQHSARLGFDLSGMYAPRHPLQGRNPLSHVEAGSAQIVGAGLLGVGDISQAFGIDAADQPITIDMRQWQLTLGISYRF
jgi:long-chain fatty acid transport protein